MKKILILCFFCIVLLNCKKEPKKGITGNPLFDLLILQRLLTPPKAAVPAVVESCKTSTKEDPLYSSQWHLNNTGVLASSVAGEDAKVTSVWTGGNYGQDVLVSVVDDGLEVSHEDLKENVSTTVLGYNSRNSSTDPTPLATNSAHGTNVGGIIAARFNNGIGLRGAAPCANLVGRNILESSITTTVENIAMTRDTSSIAVSNNSWGAADNTGNLVASSTTWQSAIETGLATGRSALGTIYTWAAGNGANNGFVPIARTPAITGITLPATSYNAEVDNSNYDGQANFYGVMAICAVGTNGRKASYSEEGANVWACAHSQGNSTTANTDAISTTDLAGGSGYNTNGATPNFSNNNYNNKFNGTSAATPLASGVIALLLQAYPKLGWRDVREIIARSARRNDLADSDWQVNGDGLNVNHKYGFGTVDAAAAINFAKTWTPLTGSQISATNVAWQTNGGTAVAITDNNAAGVSQNITVTGSGITKIEWVSLDFTSTHTALGDLTVVLTGPSGTNSILMKKHFCFNTAGTQVACQNFGGATWRFGSARHLGEVANGTWTVRVWDTDVGDSGTFVARISFRGR